MSVAEGEWLYERSKLPALFARRLDRVARFRVDPSPRSSKMQKRKVGDRLKRIARTGTDTLARSDSTHPLDQPVHPHTQPSPTKLARATDLSQSPGQGSHAIATTHPLAQPHPHPQLRPSHPAGIIDLRRRPSR